MIKVVILGPPGAGKGTQAKTLAEKLNLFHISTGDLLRENVQKGSSLGQKAKEFMEKGELVPDELVDKMIVEKINSLRNKKGFVLDGYPRNVSQAKFLDTFLKNDNQDTFIIYLDTSEPVIVERLSGRRICAKCQTIYHIKNIPPKKDSVCDLCGAPLYQRPDDKEETIKKRLSVYLHQTRPLLDYYKDRVKRVCADEEKDMVFNRILKMIKDDLHKE
ncbi:MAG: adenylate kinase [Candidatus Omnitrophica bacterium]|nr:adenylate kinase [Candidatus Omnitrophota bacterium]